jgi:hypothetical protein
MELTGTDVNDLHLIFSKSYGKPNQNQGVGKIAVFALKIPRCLAPYRFDSGPRHHVYQGFPFISIRGCRGGYVFLIYAGINGMRGGLVWHEIFYSNKIHR